MMRYWLWLGLVGCGEKEPCADGYGRTAEGRCVPLDMDGDTGTGDPSDNTPPTAPGISIWPASPRAGASQLECRVDVQPVDVDGDSVTVHLAWSSNQGDAVDGASVDAGDLIEGVEWTCTATPSDGVDEGPAASATVVIGAGYVGWSGDEISLSTSDYLFTGENGNDGAGGYVSSAGDVDGDGRSDILIGAFWNDDGGRTSGKAYLVFGASLGAERHIPLADADWHLIGEEGVATDGTEPPCEELESGANDDPEVCGGDWAGHSVNGAGDVDGDGLDDVIVCAYRADDPFYDAGKTYLIYGANLQGKGTLDLADADVHFLGENVLDRMGHSITSAGDVDGDGRADLVMGAYGNDEGGELAGKAYLMLGASLDAGARIDFREDVDYAWVGEEAGDEAGYITAPGGDVDGDGLGDFFIAAMRNKEAGSEEAPTGENGAGKVYVILGADLPPPGTIMDFADVDRAWLGQGGGDAVGYGTSSPGDVDGDGLSDLLTGAYGNSENGTFAGKVHVVTAASMSTPGTRSLADAAYGFLGEEAGNWAGFATGPAGDVDLDGRGDILVGSFWYSPDLEDLMEAGKSYLIRIGDLDGPGTHELGDIRPSFVGEYWGDVSGYKVGAAGDVNGDGLADLLIGGWQGNSATDAGKVWLLLNP